MEIEFDVRKADSNFRKHRISFAEAATSLNDPLALCIEDPDAKGENRWIVFGMSNRARLLAVVYTLRVDRIRIISARKATRFETTDYAQGI
jgi:hypothetical protein